MLQEPFSDRAGVAAEVHRAAEHDTAGVDRVHESGDRDAEPASGVVDNRVGQFVARDGCIVDTFAGQFVFAVIAFFVLGLEVAIQLAVGNVSQTFSSDRHDAGCRCVGFELPTSAAPLAQLRIGRGVDQDVPALASKTVDAIDEFVLDDDPTANTRAERQQQHRGVLRSAAEPEFSVGGCVGVIEERNVSSGRFTQFVDDREIPPRRQLRWRHEPSAGKVHRSGRAHSDAGHFADHAASFFGFVDEVRQSSYCGLRAFRLLRGDLFKRDRVPVMVDEAALDTGATDIDTPVERSGGGRRRERVIVDVDGRQGRISFGGIQWVSQKNKMGLASGRSEALGRAVGW